MKHAASLVKKEREAIFKLFIENEKLKFNEIEKSIGIRSNMASYHIEKMIGEKILQKKGEYYSLTKEAERYLPIFSHIVGLGMSPLPVVLVALTDKDKILLIKRHIRPYKNYWSLIGGKMSIEESFSKAASRQIKNKTGLDGKFVSINSVLHEKVEGDSIIKHSFILFFVKMNADTTEIKKSLKSKLKWVKLSQISKEKIIPSDLWLIKNRLNSKIDVISAHMSEKEGELSSFRILE